MGLKAGTTPQTATANWGAKVGQAGQTWSKGYLAAAPRVFSQANIKPQNWVQGVNNPDAAAKYAANMANVNMSQLTTVVNSSGQSKYTTSGTNKQSKMLAFQIQFIPKLQQITQTLDQSSPRGPRGSAQNRSRLNNYLDAVAATRGQN